MSRRVEIAVTERGRALRNNATREERKMWELLSRYRPKFTRQLPIGPYIVDFACRQAKLVVEIDGGQHAESDRDIVRDQWLADQGWSVFRVWNSDVREIQSARLKQSSHAPPSASAAPTPSPSLPGRGGRGGRPLSYSNVRYAPSEPARLAVPFGGGL
jgi:very-short-patch-repair endonuclease